jgi:hypothetical protein
MLRFLPKYAEEELDGYLSQASSPVSLGIVIRLCPVLDLDVNLDWVNDCVPRFRLCSLG